MAKKERAFAYHWGSGYIAEEAQVESEYHLPTIQLLKYTDGHAAGHSSIRFCHYSLSGRFSRSPLMMSIEDLEAMRDALAETPELRDLLRTLVE